MPKSKSEIHEIQPKKRGRKSGVEIRHQVALALKHVQDLEYLDDSPLARLPAVRELAEGRFQEAALPTGFALRVLLIDSAKVVSRDFGDMSRYQREIKFLKAYVNGRSVAEISRDLGLSREHVTRTIQPRVIGLVSRVFLARAGNDGTIGTTSRPIAAGCPAKTWVEPWPRAAKSIRKA